MRYAVLGPLEVTIDRQPTALPAAKHRIVLATLLLSANRPVSVDELAERLWGEEPPASAKATLQGYVLRLRRTLTAAGVDPVRTRPPGYLIEVGPAELDLDRFKALVAEAESAPAAVAADRLREALDLWRGPALSDVPSPSLHFAAGRWLAELRINALERRIDADLRLGRHADLLGELAGLVADSPLHEPFRAQLMLALHRAGRSADALETYRDARATFVAELGIEPGERLREVERGVLVGDPALDWRPEAPVPSSAVSRPQALPPDVPDLVGRASLADDLVARLAAPSAHSGTPVVQVIAGMSGVGKSALAVHIGHRLRPHFTDGRLHATLRDATGPLHPAEVLGRLLRQLGVLGTHLPDSVEGRSTLLRDRLAGRRVLLVLDDAVDEAQVRPLIPGDECSAVLVTSRNRLTGLAGARTVDLTVLDDGDSLRLLETVLGVDRVAAEPVAARDLIRHCGGLPLALRIAAARLAARANRPLSWLVAQLADEQRRLDGLEAGDMQVRASLATGYRALDGERQRALRLLASVNNADYSPRLAAAVLDRPPHRAERLVEDLVDAQLLELVADRYRMHGLVRVYAREQAMSDRERDEAVERALSAWLAAAEEAEAMLPNAGWLPHLSGRGSASSVDPMAWFEVERQELAVAIDQAAAEGHVGHAWRLAAACEGFLEVRGHWDDWRRCQERALVAAVVGRDRWGEARMRYGLGRLCFAQDRHELAERLLRQALELWRGDRLSQAHALMAVGDVHHHNGRLDLARACFEEAAAGYAAEHDERGTVNAGFCLGLLSRDLGDVDAAKSALAAALAAFRGLGDSYGQAQVLLFLGASHCKWGDQDAAERCLTEATALYRGFGDRLGELRSLRQLGHALVMRGETARAERVLTGCQRAFAEIGDVFGEAFTGWSLAELALRDGDERLGRHRLTAALELFTRAGLEPWQRRMRRRLAELGRSAAL